MGSNKEIVDPVLDVYQIDTIIGIICLKKIPRPYAQGTLVQNVGSDLPAGLFYIEVIYGLPQEVLESVGSQWFVIPVIAGLTHPGSEVAHPSRFVPTLNAPQAPIGQKTITEGLVLCR
jgi:hypothetical protein